MKSRPPNPHKILLGAAILAAGAFALHKCNEASNKTLPTIKRIYSEEREIIGFEMKADLYQFVRTNCSFYSTTGALIDQDGGEYNLFNGNVFIPIDNFIPIRRNVIDEHVKVLKSIDDVVLTMVLDFESDRPAGCHGVIIDHLELGLTRDLLNKHYDWREKRLDYADWHKVR